MIEYSSACACSCRLLPRSTCNTQRMYRCSRVHIEACLNSNSSINHIFSETQSLLPKRPQSICFSSLGALVTSTTEDVPSTPLVGDEKIGVLLLNLGGPETLDDVQPFLFNLFADPVILHYLNFYT